MKQGVVMEYTHSYALPMEPDMYLFRYEGIVNTYESGMECHISLNKYPVVRKTNACDVIDNYGNEKFVQRKARRRFAYPTLDLAWNSFKIRTRWRVGYAQNALDKANMVTEAIKQIEEELSHEQS